MEWQQICSYYSQVAYQLKDIQRHLIPETLDSTATAICQSSNKFGYSSGSARDSAAFGFICKLYSTVGPGQIMKKFLTV